MSSSEEKVPKKVNKRANGRKRRVADSSDEDIKKETSKRGGRRRGRRQ